MFFRIWTSSRLRRFVNANHFRCSFFAFDCNFAKLKIAYFQNAFSKVNVNANSQAVFVNCECFLFCERKCLNFSCCPGIAGRWLQTDAAKCRCYCQRTPLPRTTGLWGRSGRFFALYPPKDVIFCWNIFLSDGIVNVR